MSAIDISRIAFATQEYRTTVPIENPTVLVNHPLAMEFDFLTLLRNESDAVAFGQKILGLRKKDRWTWTCYVNKAYYPTLEIGQTITIPYPRYGFDAGADFIIKRIKTDSNALFDELSLFGPKGKSYEGYALALDFENSEYWYNELPFTALSAMSGYSYSRAGVISIDKPAGTLGPDLLANGDFAESTAGWTTAGNVSVLAGKLYLTSTASVNASVDQNVSGLQVGKRYRVTIKVDVYTGPSGWYVNYAGQPSGSTWLFFNYLGVGVYTTDFTAELAAQSLHVETSSWAGASQTIVDYVKVQEVLFTNSYGDELISNAGPGFTDTTGWASGQATLTIENNMLKVTSNASGFVGNVGRTITTVVGKTYTLRVRTNPGNGAGSIRLGTTVQGTEYINYTGADPVVSGLSEGVFTFVARSTTTILTIYNSSSGNNLFWVYLIYASLKEVITDSADSFLANVPAIVKGKGYQTDLPRTQVNLWSNDFTNAVWTKGATTVTADAFTSSDGSIVLDKVTETAVNLSHTIYQPVTWQPNVNVSVLLRAAERRYVVIRIFVAVSDYINTVVDLVTGQIYSVTDNSATLTQSNTLMTNLGGGLWRFTANFGKSVAGTVYSCLNIVTVSNPTYDTAGETAHLGVVGSGIFMGEFQVVHTTVNKYFDNPRANIPIITATSAGVVVGEDNLNLALNPIQTDQDFIFWGAAEFQETSGGVEDWLGTLGSTVGASVILGRRPSGAITVFKGGAFIDLAGVTMSDFGRAVVLYRRAGGRDTVAAKVFGQTVIGAQSGVTSWPVLSTNLDVGWVGFNVSGNPNGILEGLYLRKGNFSDLDVFKILEAA